MPEGTGVKQRVRYRFAEAGQWPIDLAVYGEVTENEREIELEGKIILQRRMGPLRFAANAWAEREYYFGASQTANQSGPVFGHREWVLNPAAGVVYEKSALVQPGIEYWMHAEHLDGGGWVIDPQHYLGPAVLLLFGKVWWSNGAYLRLNGLDTPAAGSGNPTALSPSAPSSASISSAPALRLWLAGGASRRLTTSLSLSEQSQDRN